MELVLKITILWEVTPYGFVKIHLQPQSTVASSRTLLPNHRGSCPGASSHHSHNPENLAFHRWLILLPLGILLICILICPACGWHHLLGSRSSSVCSANFWCMHSRWKHSSTASLSAAPTLQRQEIYTHRGPWSAASPCKKQNCKVRICYTQCNKITSHVYKYRSIFTVLTSSYSWYPRLSCLTFFMMHYELSKGPRFLGLSGW